MHDYLNLIIERLEQGKSMAGLTVIEQNGSTPRGTGSKMLVEKGSNEAVGIWGSIGGGLVEAKAMEVAMQTIGDGQLRIIEFDLSGEMRSGAEMICGGKLSVLSELFSPVDLDFFLNYQDGWKIRKPIFVSINLADGERRLLDEKVLEPDQILIKAAKKQRNSCLVSCQGKDYFVEYKPVVPRLILVGGGHVGLYTAKIMHLTGFEFDVIDDRQEYSNRSRFPEAKSVLVKPEFENCFVDLDIDKDSYIVILTHGHLYDCTVLTQALRTKAGYIGMIGSSTKRNAIFETLGDQGFSTMDLERVHSPIGVQIKAETPQEIAVSIAAELIAALRGV